MKGALPIIVVVILGAALLLAPQGMLSPLDGNDGGTTVPDINRNSGGGGGGGLTVVPDDDEEDEEEPPIVEEDTWPTYQYLVTSETWTYSVYDNTSALITTSSNATTAIQAALNSLTVDRTTQEKVIMQGDFATTGAISVPSYTVLELNGTVTLATGSDSHMVEASDKEQIEIVGGDWDGNMLNNHAGTSTRGFNFESCSYVTIRDLGVHDVAYDNIACLDCSFVNVTGCDIYNAGNYALGESYWGHGLGMYWSSNCTVDGNHIYDCASGGCYFYCEDDSTVQYNNYNTIINNLVERTMTSGLSIGMRGAEDVAEYGVISNNTCINCGMDGYHPSLNFGFSDATGQRMPSYCVMENNTVTYDGSVECGCGIEITAQNSTVRYNTINNTYWAGILVSGQYNEVSHNDISDVNSSWSAAIQVYDGNYNEVSNNTIYRSADGTLPRGLSLYTNTDDTNLGSSNNRLIYNTVTNATELAVMVYDAPCANNEIAYNTFVGVTTIDNGGTNTNIHDNN